MGGQGAEGEEGVGQGEWQKKGRRETAEVKGKKGIERGAGKGLSLCTAALYTVHTSQEMPWVILHTHTHTHIHTYTHTNTRPCRSLGQPCRSSHIHQRDLTQPVRPPVSVCVCVCVVHLTGVYCEDRPCSSYTGTSGSPAKTPALAVLSLQMMSPLHPSVCVCVLRVCD